MIPLGNFDLHAPIGRGGMAEVWAGVHRQAKVPVAVKVMTNQQVQDGKTFAVFRNEVRAMAGLWHPHIVRVLDMGEVGDEAQRLSEGRIQARSPYVVMELVEGGSLRMLCGRLSWSQLRRILLSLLDALAHAHARGVVHRDIKPGNVLLGGRWHEVKLTDFGLAHAVHAAATDDDVIGTPAYMAPEQFRGQWRDYGPWTDLYSLGCLVYSLTTGQPPFGRVKGNAARTAHLVRPVPPLVPKQPIPGPFHAWVHQLLEKDPARRFRCAADAAWALLAIPDERMPGDPEPTEDAMEDDDTMESMSTLTFVRPPGADENTPALGLSPLELSAPLPNPLIPPVPETWRRGLDDEVDSPLQRALGKGVYRLRRIPLVDREAERDALWEALRRANAGIPGVVLLEGPGGTGVSRLAEWICERASEVGAASPMVAFHSSIGNATHGLRPMIIRAFGAHGLPSGPVLMDRVKGRAMALGFDDPADHLAMYALVADDGPIQLTHRKERSGVLQRLLFRLAAERPVILWLDDVQWAGEGLSFVKDLVSNPVRRVQSLLVVMTARADELADNREVSALVDGLLQDAKGARIHVGPLEGRYRQVLVANLLGLRLDLAEQIDARTGGNPLFAIQLVGDWIDRGLLVLSPQGYALEPRSDIELPDDLFAMWSSRLERFLQLRRSDDAIALEIGAALGHTVDPHEWRSVLDSQDVRPSPWLIEDLVEARLATAGQGGPEHGWSFVHGMFRECLERRAENGGRSASHHRACAIHLQKQNEGLALSERIAKHYALAGDRLLAIDAYLNAIHHKQMGGLLIQAKALNEELFRTLEASGLAPSDSRWGLAQVQVAFVAQGLGDWPAMEAAARTALQDAEKHGWPVVRAKALGSIGRHALRQGRVAEAETWCRDAVAAAEGLGDLELQADALIDLGEVLLRQGRLDEARACQLKCLDVRRLDGDRPNQGNALLTLGEIARQQGDLDAAEKYVLEARELFSNHGSQTGLAGTLNNLGDIARLRGRLVEAQSYYVSARRVLESMDMVDAVYPRLNLAIVAMEMELYGEARALVEGILRETATFRKEVSALAQLVLATCAAYEHHWEELDQTLDAADRWLHDGSFVEIDIARTAHRGFELARAAGQHARADRFLRLEAQQHEALREQGKTAVVAPAQ